MKKRLEKNIINDSRGITLYIAVTITAALVLVSFAVLNLTIKEISISASGRDSQAAFYAADSAVECALFWDLKNPTDPAHSAFATTTALQTIDCNNSTITLTKVGATTTFSMLFPPNQYCANVSVVKSYVSGSPKTKIESRGYNSCSITNTRRIERAVLVNY